MLKLNKTLERHNHGVAYFAWSPNSTRLAVCGPEDCDEVILDFVLSRNLKKSLLVWLKKTYLH